MNTLLLLLAPWANIDGQQVSKEIQSNTISSNGIWMFMKGLTNQRNLIKELLDFPPGCSSMWKTKLCCWPCEDSISISQMSFWQMRDRNQPLIPAWGSIQAKPRRDLLICNYFQINPFRWFQINWELGKKQARFVKRDFGQISLLSWEVLFCIFEQPNNTQYRVIFFTGTPPP